MDHRPTFTALRALESLVRCGSLQKAADDLHVSPGAVSQQVRILEAELGAKLFDRGGRAMKATHDAQELARVISHAFDMIHQAVDRLADVSCRSQINIALLPSIATRFVIPRLDDLRRVLPDAQLNFSYVHKVEDAINWSADVLICAIDCEYGGKGASQRIFSGAVRPYASVDYLARKGRISGFSDINNAKLLHDFNTSGWRSWYERAGIDPSGSSDGDVFEDFELLIHAALAHQGIALCPPILISKEIESGRLMPVFDLSVLEDRNYVIVVSDGAAKEASIFADWIVRLASEARMDI